jgi:hypothetical protein
VNFTPAELMQIQIGDDRCRSAEFWNITALATATHVSSNTSMQGLNELLGANTRLLKDSRKCSGLQLAMVGHDTAVAAATQYDMATSLPYHGKS